MSAAPGHWDYEDLGKVSRMATLRIIGVLGVTLLMALALASTAAGAEIFHSEVAEPTLKGEQVGSFNDKLTVDAGTEECESATYTGSLVGAGSTSTEAKLSPSYSGCTASFGLSVTVDTNGCEWVFHADTSKVDLACPSGKSLAVTAPGCEVVFSGQSTISSVSAYTNNGAEAKRDITVDTSLTGIRYTEHNKGFFPNCVNNGIEESDGKYSGATTVRAEKGGTTKGLWFHGGVAKALGSLPVVASFDGSSKSIEDFANNWGALGWAGGGTPKGEVTTSGWRSLATYPTINGAYYGSTLADAGSGCAAVVTMAANPGGASRNFALWLDVNFESEVEEGYALRFTYVSVGTYTVSLERWKEGVKTVLASESSYSFANGNSLAIADTGESVSAWISKGSGFNQLLSASDSTFEAGNPAIEAAGNATRLTNFKGADL